MSILTDDIGTLHMEDQYEHISVRWVPGIPFYEGRDRILVWLFEACPLEEWPDYFIERCKLNDIARISHVSKRVHEEDKDIDLYECYDRNHDLLFTIRANKNRPDLFEAAAKVASKTIALELIPVRPMDPPHIGSS